MPATPLAKGMEGVWQLEEIISPDQEASDLFGSLMHIPPPIPERLILRTPNIGGKILYHDGAMITAHNIGGMHFRCTR